MDERSVADSFSSGSYSLPKLSNSRMNMINNDSVESMMRYKSSLGGRNITDVENFPIISSPYDEKMRRMLQLNPQLYTNRVHIPWYRRYTDVIPEKDQQFPHQPYKEIQARDEDIALQHQFGYHECLQEYFVRGMSQNTAAECKRIRDFAMARYDRIKKREEEKKERAQRDAPVIDENTFTLPGQDIDLTTEFGYSANKRKVLSPIVNFLCKLHVNRDRETFRKRLGPNSRWRQLNNDPVLRANLKALVVSNRKTFARNRIKRVFSLVLCVDRFIKCVAMIAGDTQTLLKDTAQWSNQHIRQRADSSAKLEKEVIFFNVRNYMKVGQVQVPFHIQLILGKPWFIRTNKEVETAVKFLEKMRCFTAYPRQFQFMLARFAWYIELPTQKVVIRQSQQAVNFYLLLHGTVRIDKLEGSPCEEENGYFRTLKKLYSQDMFGDECITQPFSERQYTATTEEKCAALDFNMHDYNVMIQTANTTEEAPDHIRFLCKLRIFDNFPKIKLLHEQDQNVTYFFFRPGTLVCKSVRDSPYVFVIRNGSCSTLHELKPKLTTTETENPFLSQRSSRSSGKSRRSAKSSDVNQAILDLLTKRSGSVDSRRASPASMVTDAGGRKPRRLPPHDKQLAENFEQNKKAFDQSKLGISNSIRNLREKSASFTKTLSNDILQKFNLGDQQIKKDESAVRQTTEGGHSRRSSLKFAPDDSAIRRNSTRIVTEEAGSRRNSLRIAPEDVSSRFADRLSSSHNLDKRPSGASVASAISAKTRTSMTKLSLTPSREIRPSVSKIVGTNIPVTLDRILGDSAGLVSRSSTNINNNAKGQGRGTKGERQQALRPSLKAHSSFILRRPKNESMEIEPPPSKYSQWCQKTLLTVTDVAGVEWLDYNDGTYNPPQEDVSLVSHGATIIMIKKDFMLKYLRRIW